MKLVEEPSTDEVLPEESDCEVQSGPGSASVRFTVSRAQNLRCCYQPPNSESSEESNARQLNPSPPSTFVRLLALGNSSISETVLESFDPEFSFEHTATRGSKAELGDAILERPQFTVQLFETWTEEERASIREETTNDVGNVGTSLDEIGKLIGQMHLPLNELLKGCKRIDERWVSLLLPSAVARSQTSPDAESPEADVDSPAKPAQLLLCVEVFPQALSIANIITLNIPSMIDMTREQTIPTNDLRNMRVPKKDITQFGGNMTESLLMKVSLPSESSPKTATFEWTKLFEDLTADNPRAHDISEAQHTQHNRDNIQLNWTKSWMLDEQMKEYLLRCIRESTSYSIEINLSYRQTFTKSSELDSAAADDVETVEQDYKLAIDLRAFDHPLHHLSCTRLSEKLLLEKSSSACLVADVLLQEDLGSFSQPSPLQLRQSLPANNSNLSISGLKRLHDNASALKRTRSELNQCFSIAMATNDSFEHDQESSNNANNIVKDCSSIFNNGVLDDIKQRIEGPISDLVSQCYRTEKYDERFRPAEGVAEPVENELCGLKSEIRMLLRHRNSHGSLGKLDLPPPHSNVAELVRLAHAQQTVARSHATFHQYEAAVNKFIASISLLEQAIGSDTSEMRAQIWFEIAESYAAKMNFPNALAALYQCISLSPKHTLAKQMALACCIEDKQYERVATLLQKIESERDPFSIILKALSHNIEEEYEEEDDSVRTVLAPGGRKQPCLDSALSLMKWNLISSAAHVFENYVVRELANGHLDDIDVHLSRVHLEALRGDPFSTLKDLQRIVQRNENDPRPILLLAHIYYEISDFSNSQDCFLKYREFANIQTDFSQEISCDEFALYRLGSLLLNTHKFDAAVDVFQQLTKTGTHCEAWFRLGQAYIALGSPFFHKAEISIGNALCIDPQCAETWGMLYQLYTQSGRKHEAEKALQRTLRVGHLKDINTGTF